MADTMSARRRRNERGGSAVKTIISIAFLAILAHSAYVFLPLYITVYNFDKEVEKEANYSSQKTNEAIGKALLGFAKEHKLDVKRENLKIERTESRMTINARYVVPVKFLFYTYNWQVDVEKSAVLF